jgi:precorrin-3B methylase
MVQRVSTVAFEGIEARAVDVQVQVAPGIPALNKASTQVEKPCAERVTGYPTMRW